MLKHETAKHIQYYCILTQQMGKKLNPVSLSWTACLLFFQIKVTSLFKGKKMGFSKRPAIDHCSIWNTFFLIYTEQPRTSFIPGKKAAFIGFDQSLMWTVFIALNGSMYLLPLASMWFLINTKYLKFINPQVWPTLYCMLLLVQSALFRLQPGKTEGYSNLNLGVILTADLRILAIPFAKTNSSIHIGIKNKHINKAFEHILMENEQDVLGPKNCGLWSICHRVTH